MIAGCGSRCALRSLLVVVELRAGKLLAVSKGKGVKEKEGRWR
jgi:hypothetical protein